MKHSVESPLEELVRRAPERLKLVEISRRMAKQGCPRKVQAISNYLHGLVKDPYPEFEEAFAAAIGKPLRAVREARQRTAIWARNRRRGEIEKVH